MHDEVDESGRRFSFYNDPPTYTQAVANAYERMSQREWAAWDERQRKNTPQTKQDDSTASEETMGILALMLIIAISFALGYLTHWAMG